MEFVKHNEEKVDAMLTLIRSWLGDFNMPEFDFTDTSIQTAVHERKERVVQAEIVKDEVLLLK